MAAALKEFAFDTSSAIGLGEHLNAIEKGDIHGALHSISNIQITSSIVCYSVYSRRSKADVKLL